jgi:uncharacterized phage protein (TIGR01671 family)
MREIKFRAWMKTDEKMAEVLKIDYRKKVVDLFYDIFSTWRSFGDIELMQYTGLRDKNGTEIYEGDILLVTSEIYTNFGKIPTGKFSKEYCEVIWKDDGWGYKVLRSDHTIEGTEIKGLKVTTKYAEVIGNIFQDGDLLRDSQSPETN